MIWIKIKEELKSDWICSALRKVRIFVLVIFLELAMLSWFAPGLF